MDRLGQLLGFLGALDPRLLKLGELLLGNEVDWTDPLALSGQPFEQSRLSVRVHDFGRVEAKLLRQTLRQAFEPLEADARIFGTPRLLRLRPSSRGRTAL